MASPPSGDRKRLAGEGGGPHGSVVRPSGELEGEGPAGDAGEEVALGIPGKLSCFDVLDVSFIDVSLGNFPGGDKVPQPRGGVWVVFVVVIHFVSCGTFPLSMHSIMALAGTVGRMPICIHVQNGIVCQ